MITAILCLILVLFVVLIGVGVRVFMPATVKRVTRDRRPRVRVHLVDPPQMPLPSIEGLLTSRRRGEYAIALPRLIPTTDGNPVELEAPMLLIPRERVAFYEVISE